MIGRVVLVSLLALSACKKKDPNAVEETPTKPTTGSSTTGTTGSSAGTPTTPSGDKRVNDSNWSPQTGPGFTINAPGPATIEKVPEKGRKRALERYTFHKADLVSYVVEITELPEAEDIEMEISTLRMRITSQTQAVRHEDFLEGEINGRDIWYVAEQGDDTLEARSKVVGKGHKIYEIRAVCPEGDAAQADADRFVASFAFTP